MDCNTPGFPVLHHLPEFAQVHVHGTGDAIQPSHPVTPDKYINNRPPPRLWCWQATDWGKIHSLSLFFKNIYVFISLATLGLSCGLWDLVPQPGVEPRPPALRAQSPSYWSTRESPLSLSLICGFSIKGFPAFCFSSWGKFQVWQILGHFDWISCFYCAGWSSRAY